MPLVPRRAGTALLFALSACSRGEPEAEVPFEAVRSGLFSPGPVASAGAFDLVLSPGGPVLIWAPPRAAAGGGVVLHELDAFGEPVGPLRRVAARDAEVVELAAAPAQDGIGVVFRETDARVSRTLALLAPSRGAPPAPQVLSTAPADPSTGRGQIAISAMGQGRVRLLHPSGAAPCAGTDAGPCVGFGFHELGPGARISPDRPWLSVPTPCPEGAASVAGLDGRFFYAVCSWRTDAPSTMAYAIDVDTYYARADEVLRDCIPLGMIAIDHQTVLLGADCGVTRRAARLMLDMKPPAEFPLADLALSCHGETATITAAGWELPLSDARAELEAILPDTIAPVGARALWTGSALLVAQRMSGELELRRYTCAGGRLHVESSAGAHPASG